MAALMNPRTLRTLTVSIQQKVKFLKCISPDPRFQKNGGVTLVRFNCKNGFHSQTPGKQGTIRRHIAPFLVGCSVTVAGLSIYYMFFDKGSSDLPMSQLFKNVHDNTSDILNANRSNNFIAHAVGEALPAVVVIKVMRTFSDSKEDTMIGHGSGFIVRSDGLILTNAHVVTQGPKLIVKMRNGIEYTATVQAMNKVSDLATIKIDAQNLPVIKLGNSSSLQLGEWVVALGCPLCEEVTVSAGIVSSKYRPGQLIGKIGCRDNIGHIQSDADTGPGSSGGPLINLAGEAVGINSSTVDKTITLAIPSDFVKKFLERIETNSVQKAKKPGYYIGLKLRSLSLTPDLCQHIRTWDPQFPPDCDHGVVVNYVITNSPSVWAELRPLDVIEKVNGVDVTSPSDVYKAVDKGEELIFTVKRSTETLELKVKPVEYGECVK